MLNIYVSTLAFLGKTPEEIIKIAKDNDLALEFSSGMPFVKNMEQLYLNADIAKIPHNYFPAPEVPFVLNLASTNDTIRETSVNHCINGLKLSKQAEAQFFSAHAGFCIDPDPKELGNKIKFKPVFSRSDSKKLFLESLKIILIEAERLGIKFLIENNVIAPFNLVENINPLLCCESEEIIWVFNEINNSRLGLLLDTAHLKVSCKTLGLNMFNELDLIKDQISAIHHSDNDGITDSNQPISTKYWFLPFIKTFNNILHVLEVKDIGLDSIKNQVKLLQQYGC